MPMGACQKCVENFAWSNDPLYFGLSDAEKSAHRLVLSMIVHGWESAKICNELSSLAGVYVLEHAKEQDDIFVCRRHVMNSEHIVFAVLSLLHLERFGVEY